MLIAWLYGMLICHFEGLTVEQHESHEPRILIVNDGMVRESWFPIDDGMTREPKVYVDDKTKREL